MTAVLVELVRTGAGAAAVDAVIAESGCRYDLGYLETVGNWIDVEEAVALLDAATRITGDPTFAQRVGAGAVRRHAGSPVATLLRSLGSPEAVLAQVTQTTAKFSTITEMETTEVGPGRVVVRANARADHRRHLRLCEWSQGLLSTPPELFGLGPARVHETSCQARGDAECRYEVTWDAEQAALARDPEQRVTALEAQLKAMSERLDSAYATAADLVSPDEVTTVLERIVERAAREVRAPQYVLAIRPGPLGELGVFSRGIDPAEAAEIAHRALEPTSSLSDSYICVEVSSSRRDYGRLVARQPEGTDFFAQERMALGRYAKHAAAVLDMAVALDEAARRNAHVTALLSLSRALAHAGTSGEIAQRLAEALPGVIDCDRAAVWRWDEAERALFSAHTWGYEPEQAERHRAARVAADASPMLRQLLETPEPIFLTPDTASDPRVGKLVHELGSAAMVVAPIVQRDEFLGVLTVSVTAEPGRLRHAPELRERLEGIASLAGPAMQNGRLVDELAFQASHDALTGALNRTGFGQLFERAVAGARQAAGLVGLLFVDLDGFKEINDVHGHDAGDELLRRVAARLNEMVRGSDTVARLGGDEFALILPDIASEAELESVAQRVRGAFEAAFHLSPTGSPIFVGASVGAAIWPDGGHTVESLVRYADAAMYRDKGRPPRSGASAPPPTL